MEQRHSSVSEQRQNFCEDMQERITGHDLAMQIYPLLGDYFLGSFTPDERGVLMKMPNGQVFLLEVNEVKQS